MAKFDEGPLTSGLFVFGTRVKMEPAGLSSASRFCNVQYRAAARGVKTVKHILA
jgi:hypothetical protein